MSLTDIKYQLLIITNSNKNARLIMEGAIGKSIQISSVNFVINTEIHIPFQPFVSNVRDVPVIISSDFFIVSGGIFNAVCSKTDQPSMSRDIVKCDGVVSSNGIDTVNSNVDLNIPYSTIFVVNFLGDIFAQSSININTYSHYMSVNNEDIETLRATLKVLRSKITYRDPPSSLIAKPISKCDDFLSFIINGENTSFNLGLTVSGVLLAGLLPVPTLAAWGIYISYLIVLLELKLSSVKRID